MKYVNEKNVVYTSLKYIAMIMLGIIISFCIFGCADYKPVEPDNPGDTSDTLPGESDKPDDDIPTANCELSGTWYGWHIDAFGTREYSLTISDDGKLSETSFYKERIFEDDISRNVDLSEYVSVVNGKTMTLSGNVGEIDFTLDVDKLVTRGFDGENSIYLLKTKVISLTDFIYEAAGTFIGTDSSDDETVYDYVLNVYNDFGIYVAMNINDNFHNMRYVTNGVLLVSDKDNENVYRLAFDISDRSFNFEMSPAGKRGTKLILTE